jgi:hypothetical protein
MDSPFAIELQSAFRFDAHFTLLSSILRMKRNVCREGGGGRRKPIRRKNAFDFSQTLSPFSFAAMEHFCVLLLIAELTDNKYRVAYLSKKY